VLIIERRKSQRPSGHRLGLTEELLQEYKDTFREYEHRYPWTTHNISTAISRQADYLENLGYLDEALTCAERARDLARNLAVDSSEAQIHNLGERYLALGRTREATLLYEEALALSTASGNPLWKANHLHSLSECFANEGDVPSAIDYVSKAIEIRKAIGDLGHEATNVESLALYMLANGDVQAACQTAERALNLAADLGSPLWPFQTTYAELLLHSDQLAGSLRLIQKALEWPYGKVWYRENLRGLVLLRLEMREDAKSAFTIALVGTDTWLQRCARNPSAWSAKGLALAGLSACGETSVLAGSVEAYQKARDLQFGLGVIAARKRLFLHLVKAVPQCPGLPSIQLAISGQQPTTTALLPNRDNQISKCELKTNEPEKAEMSPKDKFALIRVLVGMDDFSTSTGRRTALGLAGLAQFSDLPEGNSRGAAGSLLQRLEGEVGKPHPLRMLIDYLLESDLNGADKKVLNGMIKKYGFLQ
jgi:tetratricopeptide (TPR) repeat protein